MNLISPAAEAGERGVGLGLSVAYGIIEEHGGTIQVESVLSEGTVFEIALPLNRPSDKCERERGSHDEDKDTDC